VVLAAMLNSGSQGLCRAILGPSLAILICRTKPSLDRSVWGETASFSVAATVAMDVESCPTVA